MTTESFITTPGITKKEREEVSVDGNIFYTNEKLRQFVIKVVEKKLPKVQSKKIKHLIENKTIIPLFMTKSLWDYFRNRYKHTNYKTGVRGFVHKKTNKIYIMMDSLLLRGISISNNLLIRVILHELIHLSFDIDAKRYLQINLPILTKYYKYVFSSLFKISKDKDITNIIQRFIILFVKHEKQRRTNFNELVDLMNKFYSYTDLEEKEFDKIGTRYIDFIELEINKKEVELRKNYKDITNTLSRSFVRAFNVSDNDSDPDQRAYITSEVIATLAMVKPKSKFVIQTINIIK